MVTFSPGESADDLLEQGSCHDPYEVMPPAEDRFTQLVRRLSRGWLGAAAAGVAAAFVLAGAAFYEMRESGLRADDGPYAYLEIKAIDPEGRPAAGAAVRSGDRPLGATDSFGEWRRFMHVTLGESLDLRVTKERDGRSLAGAKRLPVPTELPASGDLELTGSVQLAPVDADVVDDAPGVPDAGRRGRALAAGRGDRAPSGERPAAAGAAARGEPAAIAPGGLVARRAMPVDDETSDDVAAAMMGAAGAAAGPRVAAEVAREAAAGGAPFTAVSLAATGKGAPALAAVIQALRQRAGELGLAVTDQAPWRIVLSEAAAADTRLLLVDQFVADGPTARPLVSFLRNAGDSPAQTARDVLWATSVAVAKPVAVEHDAHGWWVPAQDQKLWPLTPGRTVYAADGTPLVLQAASGSRAGRLRLSGDPRCAAGAPCYVATAGGDRAPPMPGQQRLLFKALGADQSTRLFVAGFAARPGRGKIFEYWGQPLGTANLTAVRGGRVIYRGRLSASGRSEPVVMLPSPPISRR